ncbi:cytochrome P450 [Melanogaster broomeanus]|nr:cytochrome P450 [Melanogaster broomeanus]
MWSAVSSHWGKYGDLGACTVIGRVIVLINSAKVAEDLLEKRSSIYSDRPRSVMAGELCEIGSYTTVQSFYPMLELESRRFLVNVLGETGGAPSSCAQTSHNYRTFTAIVLRIAYGYEVKSGHDYFVDLAHVANEQFVQCDAYQENTTWTFYPFLKYVPSWLPGAGFRRIAKKYAATMKHLSKHHLRDQCRKESGTHSQSFVSRHLAQNPNESEEELIKWAANVMYQDYIPKKAQAELDAVVGSDRLPTFADRPSLPYCEACLYGAFAMDEPWALSVREENHYQGYTIPAAHTCLSTFGTCCTDEKIYKDANTFNPEQIPGR